MIYIVDDSQALRARLINMLSEIDGIRVIGQAGSGGEAILGIRNLKPRVVILDIQMPDGNGIEVLKTIKQESQPPIVLMFTNHLHPRYKEKCMELGADYFLDKTRDFGKMTEIFKGLVKQFEQEKLPENFIS